jgi:hypothetical protein
LSAKQRQATYSLLTQQFRLRPDRFFADTFTQQRPPDPQPREDSRKIKVESAEELTAFDPARKIAPPATITNEHAVELIASYLKQLRDVPQKNTPALSLDGAPRVASTASAFGKLQRGQTWAGWKSLFATTARGKNPSAA